jgi:hypothetical protein
MTEMRLIGIEPETDIRDLFTFECDECGRSGALWRVSGRREADLLTGVGN